MQPEQTTASIERGRPPLTRRSAAADGTASGLATAQATPTSAAPAAPAALAAGRLLSDAPWSTVFGSPTLPSGCRTVAVAGSTVYLGGDFIYGMAGTANDTYERVAMWDGSGWQPMGSGLGGAVNAIAVAAGDVYVGGDFTVAGGKVAAAHLARWDGTSWSAVPGSPTDPDRDYGTTVTALVTDGRTLYVGGTFTRVGSDQAPPATASPRSTSPPAPGPSRAAASPPATAPNPPTSGPWRCAAASSSSAAPSTGRATPRPARSPPGTRPPAPGIRTARASATRTSPASSTRWPSTPPRGRSTSVGGSPRPATSAPGISHCSRARPTGPSATSVPTAGRPPR